MEINFSNSGFSYPDRNEFSYPITDTSSLPPVPSPCPRRTNRAQFALFVKILLKQLARSQDDYLHQQACEVIATCTRRNRMGDIHFSPLEDVLEGHLHQLVGDQIWKKAELFQQIYLQQKCRSRRSTSNSAVLHQPRSLMQL